MKKPLILVVNDDGIQALGIRALIGVARKLGDVLVVAPDKPQSGMGHAITLDSILHKKEVLLTDGLVGYACSGTPVDCVKLAVDVLADRKIDLVVSGINHGSNASVNVLYSGTMSAAVEGALEGIPSVGFSLLDHSLTADFSVASVYAEKILKEILKEGMPKGVCWNVNIPKLPASIIKGIRVCRQGRGNWIEEFDVRLDPSGNEYYWLTGKFDNYEPNNEETDLWALDNNYVTIVPVQHDMTDYNSLNEIKIGEKGLFQKVSLKNNFKVGKV